MVRPSRTTAKGVIRWTSTFGSERMCETVPPRTMNASPISARWPPVEGLGAHDGGPTLCGKIPELVEAASELFGLHVISEASEASAAPAAIGGFAALTLPEPSQPRQMDIAKRGVGEIDLERLAVELGRMSRPGDGPDVGEAVNVGRPEEAQEILQAAGRVPDGVQPPHSRFHFTGLV